MSNNKGCYYRCLLLQDELTSRDLLPPYCTINCCRAFCISHPIKLILSRQTRCNLPIVVMTVVAKYTDPAKLHWYKSASIFALLSRYWSHFVTSSSLMLYFFVNVLWRIVMFLRISWSSSYSKALKIAAPTKRYDTQHIVSRIVRRFCVFIAPLRSYLPAANDFEWIPFGA